jgi:hypothetical protein
MRTLARNRAGFVVGLLGLIVPLALTTASPAAGGSTSKWLTISSGNIGTTGTTPSIARFGHNYEVVWVAKPDPPSRSRAASSMPPGSQRAR